jgi:hypothetical protein
MADPPKRRFLRFNLRTMFVAFTVVAVWLGWNLRIVREREATLRLLREADFAYSELQDTPRGAQLEVARQRELTQLRRRPYDEFPPTASPQLSMLRRWLGDRPVRLIIYQPGTGLVDVQSLFPEAMVYARRAAGQ